MHLLKKTTIEHEKERKTDLVDVRFKDRMIKDFKYPNVIRGYTKGITVLAKIVVRRKNIYKIL